MPAAPSTASTASRSRRPARASRRSCVGGASAGQRGPVGARLGHGVVGVGGGQQARRRRTAPTAAAGGGSRCRPAARGPAPRSPPPAQPGDPGQDALGVVGVHAHPLPLGLGERARLVPDAQHDAGAAEVVQVPGARQALALGRERPAARPRPRASAATARGVAAGVARFHVGELAHGPDGRSRRSPASALGRSGSAASTASEMEAPPARANSSAAWRQNDVGQPGRSPAGAPAHHGHGAVGAQRRCAASASVASWATRTARSIASPFELLRAAPPRPSARTPAPSPRTTRRPQPSRSASICPTSQCPRDAPCTAAAGQGAQHLATRRRRRLLAARRATPAPAPPPATAPPMGPSSPHVLAQHPGPSLRRRCSPRSSAAPGSRRRAPRPGGRPASSASRDRQQRRALGVLEGVAQADVRRQRQGRHQLGQPRPPSRARARLTTHGWGIRPISPGRGGADYHHGGSDERPATATS